MTNPKVATWICFWGSEMLPDMLQDSCTGIKKESNMLNIGQIAFVNVAPFHYFWKDDSINFIHKSPRDLAILASQGKIDCAPLPTFSGFTLEEKFEPLGSFGIAAKDRVMSVLLFSDRPVESLSGCKISLTEDSATSVSLLRLLLLKRYGLKNIEYTFRNPNAALFIGDNALKELHGSKRWNFCYDLASLWQEWTGLPFVFARWLVRNDLPASTKIKLKEAVSTNLDKGEKNITHISQREARRIGMPEEIILEYLQNFIYRLGHIEIAGINLFRQKLTDSGLLNAKNARILQSV